MKYFSKTRATAAIALALIVSSVTPVVAAQAATLCVGTVLLPGASIQSAISAKGTGATFCLSPGTYNVTSPIVPKDGDKFIGTGVTRDDTVVSTSSAELLFNTRGVNNVTFNHFAITGGINRCPGSNCGATGRGISGGSNLTAEDMHIYGNGLNAIGGMGDNLKVNNSEIDHNGYKVGDGVSDGIKMTAPFVLTNSFLHDNQNSGIHCDIQCGAFTVAYNTITNNTGTGILMEISAGPATIHDNIVQYNNPGNTAAKGGISIKDSKNVEVYNNTLGHNFRFGIRAGVDSRINCGTPSATCGFVLSNVSIHDNTLALDKMVGCDIVGVLCSKNV
jgi:Right handed beta helix region